MAVVGLVLIVIAALVVVAALLGGSDDPVSLDLGVFDLSTSTLGVFLVGAATVLILVAGLELLRSGLRRSLRRRRELKQARAAVARHERREGRHAGEADAAAGTDVAAAEAPPERRPDTEPPAAGGDEPSSPAR